MTTTLNLQHILDAVTAPAMIAKLGKKKAADMATAIDNVCKWLDCTPSQRPASELAITSRIEAARLGADALGIAARTFTNIVGRVKSAVRMINKKSMPSFTRKQDYAPDWRATADELDDLVGQGKLSPHHRRGVAHIMGFANWRGIARDEFTSEHLAELVALHVAEGGSGRKALDGCRAWNAIVDSGLASLFPATKLWRESRKRQFNPNWEEYPASLRDDLSAYLKWLQRLDDSEVDAGFDPDDPDAEFGKPVCVNGRPERKRAAGAKHCALVETVVQQTAGALVRRGTPQHQIRMLADTANVGALRASLHDIRQRHEAEGRFKADSGYRYAAGSILWTIARDWTGAPGDVIDQMKRDTKKVKPKHQGYMAPSRQKMLDMFDEPARLLAWFDQPAKLLERAERLRRQGRITPSSIVDVQVALLIQMINVLPARPGNLCGQRFKGDPERRNLLLPRTKGGPLFMLWRPSEVKNHEHLKAELDPDAVATLRLYLEHYFPAALRFAGLQDSDYLFPGRKSDKPKSEKQMNRCFRKRMAKAGLDMTLHLGRHLAAKIILDEDEGLIEVVSRLLGHKSLETTRRFYLGTRTEKASERYREVIEAKTAKLRGCRRIRKIRKDDNV